MRSIRTFKLHSGYLVTVTNNVDKATSPRGFHFIENSILRDGISRADDGFKVGCECAESGYSGCYCLQDVEVKDNKLSAPKEVNAYLWRDQRRVACGRSF